MLAGWKARKLSFVGRMALSQAVIQAVPIYPMVTMPFPSSCINEIQRLQRAFICGEGKGHRRHHLIYWDTLILPKKLGRLDIHNLHYMNHACFMKLGWQLHSGGSNLWCIVMKGKYGWQSFSEFSSNCP